MRARPEEQRQFTGSEPMCSTEILMRSIAERRFPIMLIILFALLGVAVSVGIGRIIAEWAGEQMK